MELPLVCVCVKTFRNTPQKSRVFNLQGILGLFFQLECDQLQHEYTQQLCDGEKHSSCVCRLQLINHRKGKNLRVSNAQFILREISRISLHVANVLLLVFVILLQEKQGQDKWKQKKKIEKSDYLKANHVVSTLGRLFSLPLRCLCGPARF